MDEEGRFLDDDGKPVALTKLPGFLKQAIGAFDGVTDVFVWVHGWQTDDDSAALAAQQLFQGITQRWVECRDYYPELSVFKPAFLALHWPSVSSFLPSGYNKIKRRASALTKTGEAEFALSSILGYLEEAKGFERPSKGVLKSKYSFYVHCVGHSFGGRFLTAAIEQAGFPLSPRSGTLRLGDRDRANGYRYSIDSILVFQMAAPCARFGGRLEKLVNSSPLGGPLVLTHSHHDHANCVWHRATEFGQSAIGCRGASEPHSLIHGITLRRESDPYTAGDFSTAKIVNVDAAWLYKGKPLDPVGAHSDFWHHESMHLVLSLTEHVRRLG